MLNRDVDNRYRNQALLVAVGMFGSARAVRYNGHAESSQLGDKAATLEGMANDYLPGIIHNFLSIPKNSELKIDFTIDNTNRLIPMLKNGFPERHQEIRLSGNIDDRSRYSKRLEYGVQQSGSCVKRYMLRHSFLREGRSYETNYNNYGAVRRPVV